jgi:hypothetical protein
MFCFFSVLNVNFKSCDIKVKNKKIDARCAQTFT